MRSKVEQIDVQSLVDVVDSSLQCIVQVSIRTMLVSVEPKHYSMPSIGSSRRIGMADMHWW
jgi:hypothetical protein